MFSTSKKYWSYLILPLFFVYQKLAQCVEFKVTVLCGGGSKNGNDNNNNTQAASGNYFANQHPCNYFVIVNHVI